MDDGPAIFLSGQPAPFAGVAADAASLPELSKLSRQV
jgi:hypothetical protein